MGGERECAPIERADLYICEGMICWEAGDEVHPLAKLKAFQIGKEGR